MPGLDPGIHRNKAAGKARRFACGVLERLIPSGSNYLNLHLESSARS